ncbi:MAG: VWA domain-containing protein [Ilumatobacteraceae bacterium]
MAKSSRRTTSRRELARRPGFEQISPEVGELDERAVDDGMQRDADATLALMADLVGATDRRLANLARRLAARLLVDIARRGDARRRGIGRMVSLPYAPDVGDLDIDASLDAIVEAVSGVPDVERLRVRSWARPATALCLLVDRSGSMGGGPLATAALAAAAVAIRAPDDYSVVAFGRDVVVVKPQDGVKPVERVVTDLLALRGHGTTDLAGALRAAALELGRSSASRRVTVLLSDCRSTVDGDPEAIAGALDELVVVAPVDDAVEAGSFCRRTGARLVTVSGPSDIPEALGAALDASGVSR